MNSSDTTRAQVREFLTTRRAHVRPEDVGLPAGPGRRVPGLRRGEVAQLAGLSVEYYTRIERGALGGATDQVLDALCRALRLDPAECEYLWGLAAKARHSSGGRHTSQGTARRAGGHTTPLPPAAQAVLDSLSAAPAILRNARMDVIASNRLGTALYWDLLAPHPVSPAAPNLARYCFLDPERAEAFYDDWDAAADITVSIMRTESGRHPRDAQLHQLVGELSTLSPDFARRWARHDVRLHASGTKRFLHSAVGPLDLNYEGLEFLGAPDLNLTVYTPSTAATAEALTLLGTWATTELEEAAQGQPPASGITLPTTASPLRPAPETTTKDPS